MVASKRQIESLEKCRLSFLALLIGRNSYRLADIASLATYDV